jgi:hypothetical protein
MGSKGGTWMNLFENGRALIDHAAFFAFGGAP